MKGKLRKIVLAMSGLMCAGMLFTCVMPAKAVFQPRCDHYTFALLGWTEWYVTSFNDEEHHLRRDERGSCAICKEEFVIQSETDVEPHDYLTVIDWSENLVVNFCKKCDYRFAFPF